MASSAAVKQPSQDVPEDEQEKRSVFGDEQTTPSVDEETESVQQMVSTPHCHEEPASSQSQQQAASGGSPAVLVAGHQSVGSLTGTSNGDSLHDHLAVPSEMQAPAYNSAADISESGCSTPTACPTSANGSDSQTDTPNFGSSEKGSWSNLACHPPGEPSASCSPDSQQDQEGSNNPQMPSSVELREEQLQPVLSTDDERSSEGKLTMSRQPTAGEDDLSERWQRRKRHFFILTAAGKPVFTRYGDEHALAGFMAIIQAMMSVMQDQGDKLQSLTTGSHVMAFALHGPLYMVAVSAHSEPVAALQKQLSRLYQQIIFIVTTSLERVCQRKPSYDVRGLLGGSWTTLRAVIRSFSYDPGWLIGAFPPLPLPATERRELTEALQEAVKASGAMYGVILAEALVVAVDHKKHVPLHPWDLQLLINFIRSNDSYRYRFGESFSPVCLPHFQASAFLHAYIRYLDPEAGLCLVLLSPSSEAFYALSDARAALDERVSAAGLLAALKRRVADPAGGLLTLDVLPKAAGGGPAGNTPLWYFVLKPAGGRPQYLAPAHREPLHSQGMRKDMMRALARVHCSMWPPGAGVQGTPPRRLHWQVDSQFALLGTIDREAELYLVMDPLTDKAAAMKLAEGLRKHLFDKARSADLFLAT